MQRNTIEKKGIMARRFAIIAGSVVGAGLLAQLALVVMGPSSSDPFAPCRVGAVSTGGAALGSEDFTLVDGTGAAVTRDALYQQPSLIYFGYTFCPDVCPFDTVRNADAVDILKERGFDLRPVFITIDPERDTPEVVADFSENVHDDMLGLSGSQEQVAAASQSFRTYAKKQKSDDEYYLVDHSTFSYLTLPDVGFVEFFRRELSAEQMADQLQCFLEAAPK